MADTAEVLDLTESYVKVFDAITNAGQSFTIQNNTLIPILYLKKSSAPDDSQRGLLLGAGKSGAVLDISDDVYFRAANSVGSKLTFDRRT